MQENVNDSWQRDKQITVCATCAYRLTVAESQNVWKHMSLWCEVEGSLSVLGSWWNN